MIAIVKVRLVKSTLSSAKLVHLEPPGKTGGGSWHGRMAVGGKTVLTQREKSRVSSAKLVHFDGHEVLALGRQDALRASGGFRYECPSITTM